MSKRNRSDEVSASVHIVPCVLIGFASISCFLCRRRIRYVTNTIHESLVCIGAGRRGYVARSHTSFINETEKAPRRMPNKLIIFTCSIHENALPYQDYTLLYRSFPLCLDEYAYLVSFE